MRQCLIRGSIPTFMSRTPKWVRRAIFALGKRPVFRDRGLIGIPRVIWKTPPVKGQRLVLKREHADERYQKAWQTMVDFHFTHRPKHYTFEAVRQYPSIRGKRVQKYHDRPSLRDLVEQKKNRRVKEFLKTNHISLEDAHAYALETYEELSHNTDRAFQLRIGASADYLNLGDQFLVKNMDSKGKMHLIMIDI